jgi:hypothetical protein
MRLAIVRSVGRLAGTLCIPCPVRFSRILNDSSAIPSRKRPIAFEYSSTRISQPLGNAVPFCIDSGAGS